MSNNQKCYVLEMSSWFGIAGVLGVYSSYEKAKETAIRYARENPLAKPADTGKYPFIEDTDKIVMIHRADGVWVKYTVAEWNLDEYYQLKQ